MPFYEFTLNKCKQRYALSATSQTNALSFLFRTASFPYFTYLLSSNFRLLCIAINLPLAYLFANDTRNAETKK
nr:MAG TPA: hypothetical protein [Caudoviricetes sp.]